VKKEDAQIEKNDEEGEIIVLVLLATCPSLGLISEAQCNMAQKNYARVQQTDILSSLSFSIFSPFWFK